MSLSLAKMTYILPINFYNNDLAASYIATELLTGNNLDLYLNNDELKEELNSMMILAGSNYRGIAKLFYSIVLDELNEEFYEYNFQFRLEMIGESIRLDEICEHYAAASEIVARLATEQNPYKQLNRGNSIFIFSCDNLQVDKINEVKTSAINECENVSAIALKDIAQGRAVIKTTIINMITRRNEGDSEANFEMALDRYLNKCIMQRTTPIGTINKFGERVTNVSKIVNTYFG